MKIQFPAVIVGLGKSGLAAKRLIEAQHPGGELKTFDHKDPSADFNTPDQVLQFHPKTLVVSPGVPLALDWIQKLIKSNVLITSELELAFASLKTEQVIAVTGSMGKSTTTSLLGAAVHALSRHNFVGGNLGFPLADYAYGVLKNNQPRANWIVLELSSYQLENFKNLQTAASLITALSPNHLERYSSLDHYYQTKWTLVKKTNGPVFLNADNAEIKRWCCPRLENNIRLVESKFYSKHSTKMVGLHNRENLSLALAVAEHFHWPANAVQAIESYCGLPHRLELVSDKNGLRYINDSKATTIESVLAAAHSCLGDLKSNQKLHLLLGGKDKNLPWEDLGALKIYPQIEFYFFGECAELAQKKSRLPGTLYSRLGPAIQSAQLKMTSGDTLLLSPGGSSLDEFKNFEERGDYFKQQCLLSFI